MCYAMPSFLDRLLSHKLVCLTKILEVSRREDEMTGILNVAFRISTRSTPDWKFFLDIQIRYRIYFWLDTLLQTRFEFLPQT